jgi:hypothetical protein
LRAAACSYAARPWCHHGLRCTLLAESSSFESHQLLMMLCPAVKQEGKPANVPKLDKILDEDSDEEVPDQELQIPAHKVGPAAAHCFADL